MLKRLILAASLLLALAPGSASAQDAPELAPYQRVRVRIATGEFAGTNTTARVMAIQGDSLLLQLPNSNQVMYSLRDFETMDVSVQPGARRRVFTGLLVGAGTGGALAFLENRYRAGSSSPITRTRRDPRTPTHSAGRNLTFIGVGAGVGLGVALALPDDRWVRVRLDGAPAAQARLSIQLQH